MKCMKKSYFKKKKTLHLNQLEQMQYLYSFWFIGFEIYSCLKYESFNVYMWIIYVLYIFGELCHMHNILQPVLTFLQGFFRYY